MIIQNPKYKLVYAEFTEDEGQKVVTIYGSESGIPDPANDAIITDSDLPLGYKLVYYKDGVLYGSESGIPDGEDEAIDTGDLFIDPDEIIDLESSGPDATDCTAGQAYDFTGLEVTAIYADGRTEPVTDYALTATVGGEEVSAETAPEVDETTTVVFDITYGGFTSGGAFEIQVTPQK